MSRTPATTNLYNNLVDLCPGTMLWGVQADQGSSDPTVSNVVDATTDGGEYPGQYPGFVEASYVDNTLSTCTEDNESPGNNNLTDFTDDVETEFSEGGVAGVHWLPEDPYTCEAAAADTLPTDGTNICQLALTTGTQTYTNFNLELQDLAEALSGLNVDDEAVPVLLRPFHEMNADTLWWGSSTCGPTEYIKLWHYTIKYLANASVDNCILVWSPEGLDHNDPDTQSQYENSVTPYYPGSNYVDVIGVDEYDSQGPTDYNETMSSDTAAIVALKATVDLASTEDKIPAMTEGENVDQASVSGYWSDYVADFQSTYPKLAAIRYAMTWTDDYSPAPDETSDFGDAFQSQDYLIMADTPQWYCAALSC